MQTAPLDLVAQTLLLASAVLYGLGVRRLKAIGRRWPATQTGLFMGGLVTIWVAVGSDLASYDDTVVTVHVVQHLLLMMVAPPLLVAGRPLVLATQALARRGQVRITRLWRSPTMRLLRHPVVGWALYMGSMYALLVDRPVYDYVVTHPLVHDATHAGLLAVGVLYFESLLGPAARLSRPGRVMAVIANMPFEVLVGLWLHYRTRSVAPGISTLADTQRAGEAFIVGATLLSTLCLVAIVAEWCSAAWREEKRAAARTISSGWSTPWWVTGSGTAAPSTDPQ
jgi:putative membrane protein